LFVRRDERREENERRNGKEEFSQRSPVVWFIDVDIVFLALVAASILDDLHPSKQEKRERKEHSSASTSYVFLRFDKPTPDAIFELTFFIHPSNPQAG